jgi:S-layer family protein
MKKVLSLVLVLTLVLGSFGFAFADTSATTTTTPKDVVGTEFEGAVTALSALGVVSGYEDGTYKPANIVTRAEMAKLIIAELGLEANATGSKSTFSDMSGYGWAEGYIGYAQSLGIVSGYGDGTFKPGKTVSYDEALTMIVSALGYTKDCKEMNGSWPAIYVQKARVLGLTDDVAAGGSVGANRGDVAIYLYNMLTANMGYADADGVYQKKEDKDGENVKVITNLDAEESEDYAVITKSDADNAVANIRQYVGAYAKVFTLTKGKNDGDIIAISDCKSDFVTGEYKADDEVIKTADGTEYKLDDISSKGICGTSKELDSDDTAIEFINGDTASKGSTILDDDQQELDTEKDGAVVTVAADLSGKTIKGIFSVQLWKSDNDEQVDADDIATIKSNQTLLGQDFALDDDDEIDYDSFELVGVNSLSDIKADDIVYVYINNDDEISRVAVGAETAEGEVTAIKEGTSESKVTIDGKVYYFASEKLGTFNGIASNFDVKDVDTEDEVKVFLDAYGYMYDYEAISGKADNYAVVLEVGTSTTNRIGEKNQIKLFLADGTDKVFDVDNDLFKKEDYVPGITTTKSVGWEVDAGSIVKYGVDKDGIIDSFEEMTDDYDYTDKSGTTKGLSISKSGYYDTNEIKKNAVIFSFEGTKAEADAYIANAKDGVDPTDEDNYGVTTLEKVLDTSDVAACYITDDERIASMLLLDYSGSDEVYGVIKETRKTAGDSDYGAWIYVNGDKKQYGLSSSSVYDDARDGAKFDADAYLKVFKLELNASGEVKKLVPAWEDKNDTYATKGAIEINSTDKATFSNDTFKVTNQDVSIKVHNNAKVYKNDNGDFKPTTTGDLKSLNTGAKVWFYDTLDDDNDGLMNIVLIDDPDKEKTPNNNSSSGGSVTIENDETSVELKTNQLRSAFSGISIDGEFMTTDYVVIDNKVIITDAKSQFVVGENIVKVYYTNKTVEIKVVKKASQIEIDVEAFVALALDTDAKIATALEATVPDVSGVSDAILKAELQDKIDAKKDLIKEAATVATVVVADVTVGKSDSNTTTATVTLKNADDVVLNIALKGDYAVTYAWTVESVAQGTTDTTVAATVAMLKLTDADKDTVTATVNNATGVDAGDNWTVKVVVTQGSIGTTNTTATVTAE